MIVTVDSVESGRPLTSVGRLLTVEADSPDAYDQVCLWAVEHGYDSLLQSLANYFSQEPSRCGLGFIVDRENGLLVLARWPWPK